MHSTTQHHNQAKTPSLSMRRGAEKRSSLGRGSIRCHVDLKFSIRHALGEF